MKKALTAVFLVFLILASGMGLTTAWPSKRVSVIVGFNNDPDAAFLQTFGGLITYKHNLISAIACQLSERAIEFVKRNPNVAYVETDGTVIVLDDVIPWGVDRIDAEAVHPYNKGSGVTVAVIDTGIDYNHPDLDANVAGGKSFVDYTTDYMDDHGHGTHVAGIIAAEDNGEGVVGVAPESSLYALKVLDSEGVGSVSAVVAAIEWSIDNGMQIISMSLGTNMDYTSLRTACDNAYTAGILLVAAGGNDASSWSVRLGWDTIDYPARYDSVIGVGGTDRDDLRASWSSTGPELELVAPGVDIYSTFLDNTYATFSGTSMACPQVTGTAALTLKTAIDPAYDSDGDGQWDPAEVRKTLQDTADDLGDPGKDPLYGYGLVEAAPGLDTTPPSISAMAFVDITSSSTMITWITDEPSDSVVNYGTIEALGNTMVDTAMVTNHSITLYELENTTYYVEVSSTDSAGNVAVDNNGGLYYVIRDSASPSTISDLTATAGTYPEIHLVWTAAIDNAGITHYKIYRSTTETINRTTDLLTTVSGTSYTDSTGTMDSTYYYAVCAVDQAGNEAELSNTASARLEAATMHVKAIDLSTTTIWSWTRAVAVVTVVDSNGNPIEGATVTGHGSGLTSGVASGITDSTGQVSLRSRYVYRASGTFTFTVDGVDKTGWIYDASANEETSNSLIV